MAPEAPPAQPPPGGRAPSFGTPLDPEEASFVISGNIAAWQTVGIGRRPEDAPADYEGTPIHVPPVVAGRVPFWRQAELSLFLNYGTPVINATVGYFAFAGGREYQGFRQAMMGPTFSQAYLTVTPEPLGDLSLRFVMGAFTETYAGPGQWGWGIFGPLIAVRGYGESSHLDYAVSRDLRVTLSQGIMGVPGIPESFPRGEWTGWTETGVSTMLHHAHLGFNYQNKYSFRLHHAVGMGTDERKYLVDEPRDGRMDVYAAEAHWYGDPWGHVGVSGGLWDFQDAFSVHDALWWGLKWTKGSQDMLRDYIGSAGTGNGRVVAVSAEYNMSLARMAWYPRPFDGRAPDVRLSIAGAAHRTLRTDDPAFDGASGYLGGLELEYQMLPWLSANLRSYAENRDWFGERWGAYNVSPGVAFRSDWQSPDRIELWYSRHFYSAVVDNNPAQPLDLHALAVGVFLGF